MTRREQPPATKNRQVHVPAGVSATETISDIYWALTVRKGLPCGSNGKQSACNVGDLGSFPGLGRSSGEGNGNPLQYSCLENPIDIGAWWATVDGVAKSQTRLSDFTYSLG